MNGRLIEAVPNFSEGRDERIVREIVKAMHVDGVHLLDWSLDAAHHRSVVTVAGEPAAVAESVVRGAGRASQLIDLTQQGGAQDGVQHGVHPRIGAADVIPLVPLRAITLDETAELARGVAAELWERYQVPSYLYEAAALRPERVRLESIRKGQFEGLREAARTDARARPDVGGPLEGDVWLHPTAGASVVGARQFLIAYNLYLDGVDITGAKEIARAIRASGGGMPGVKAMGVMAGEGVQLTMNVTDLQHSPMRFVYERAEELTAARGGRIRRAELIGLIPASEYEPDANWVRPIPGFDPRMRIIETRIESPMAWPI